MIFLGIDPGVSGGLAALAEDGRVLAVTKMPETDQDIRSWMLMFDQGPRIRGEELHCRPVHACVERVNPGVFGRPGAKMGVVSAFTFGGGYHRLLMCLACMVIPFDLVNAAVWQLNLSCRSKGDKNVTKRRAQQLFPHEKVTHAIADALLIAEYCRRIHGAQGVAPTAPRGLFDGEEEGRKEEADQARPDAANEGRHTEAPRAENRRAGTPAAASATPRRRRRSRQQGD